MCQVWRQRARWWQWLYCYGAGVPCGVFHVYHLPCPTQRQAFLCTGQKELLWELLHCKCCSFIYNIAPLFAFFSLPFHNYPISIFPPSLICVLVHAFSTPFIISICHNFSSLFLILTSFSHFLFSRCYIRSYDHFQLVYPEWNLSTAYLLIQFGSCFFHFF